MGLASLPFEKNSFIFHFVVRRASVVPSITFEPWRLQSSTIERWKGLGK
jgi:hypothetical protein